MYLTVADILKFDFFPEARVVTGEEGLNREVKYVDILEVPDIEGWVRESGFFLTTGFSIKDDKKAQKRLVKYLYKAKSAALCIKKGRYFKTIPDIMIKEGEKYGLPIIELPPEVPYADILIPLMSKLLEKQAYLLQRSEKIHTELSRIVLKGGGLDLIVQTLYKLISRPVLIQDKKMRILALIAKPEDEKKIKENLQFPEDELFNKFSSRNSPVRFDDGGFTSRIISPIIVAGKIFGFVSIFETEGKLEKINFRAVEHTSTIIALEMLKEKERTETEKRLKVELVEDLLKENYNSHRTIIQRAQYLNWDFEKDYLLLVLDIKFNDYFKNPEDRSKDDEIQFIKDKIKTIVKSEIYKSNRDKIFIYKGNSLIIFWGCNNLSNKLEKKQKSLEFAGNIYKRITEQFPALTLSIGIGNYHSGINGLKTSYEEALKAIEIGKKVANTDDIFHYDQLGVYKVLVKFREDPELIRFYRDTLGPLLEEDSAKMLETVDALLKNFANKTKAAKELNIHRNSLDYRIHKLEEILDINLDESENWLNLFLALKIHNLRD